jgi:uncharacterized protein YutD
LNEYKTFSCSFFSQERKKIYKLKKEESSRKKNKSLNERRKERGKE